MFAINFLKFKGDNVDLKKMEQELNINLPPLYKAFHATFELLYGHESFWEHQLPENLKNREYYPKTYYYFEYMADIKGYEVIYNVDIGFQRFLDLEEIHYALLEGGGTERWEEEGVIPIGETGHGGGLVIGIKPNNLDMIFFENDMGLSYIAENIFEFIKKLKVVPGDTDQLSLAYRNWNEDFWRIRGEGENS
jgi:hypothetical protein